jgi:hypothetical protein
MAFDHLANWRAQQPRSAEQQERQLAAGLARAQRDMREALAGAASSRARHLGRSRPPKSVRHDRSTTTTDSR